MTDRTRLRKYADQLIKQKKMIQATHYLLITVFIVFSAGTLLALPLRYFLGFSYHWPIFLAAAASALSFIYGFLGLDNAENVFQQMDDSMHLNEKMSAAWQFGHTDNPYSRLLLEDASSLMEEIEPSQVFKLHFSRRDPFIPLLMALFLFLWMGSFSFLEISDEQQAKGEYLVETSERIDAVIGDDSDKALEEISEEYEKLGQKIQDRFMNEQSLENEVEKLSRKLEEKIAELSREGVDRDSKVLGEDEADSEVYQLERKREMNEDLQDILDSLMKTFSITPDMGLSGGQSGEREQSGEGGTSGGQREEQRRGSQSTEEDSDSADDASSSGETTHLNEGDSSVDPREQGEESDSSGNKPGQSEGLDKEDTGSSDIAPEFDRDFEGDEQFDPNQFPGNDTPDDMSELKPLKEERQSGEFDKEENIEGDLQEGEQMKSFIRALPHIVEPTREEMEVLRYYRNQLESTVDKEILPEGYEEVIRDYFLGIGVLNDE